MNHELLALVRIADVTLATLTLLIVLALRFTKRMSDTRWRMYWAGFAIGMIWELGFYLNGPRYSDDPAYQLNFEFPIHPHTQPLLHSLWDAGLFMIGVWLVTKLCRAPHLARFRWPELFVMLVWGQLQELCVELTATAAGAWTFTPRAYNPVLFEHGIGHVTLIPQLIWFVAPIAFYLVALAIRRRTPE